MTAKKIKSKLMMMFGLCVLAVGMVFASPITAYASQAFNPPPVRNQPAPEQRRFNWEYEFESGMDYRFDLGRPTTFNGVVPQDVMTANVRRDANVSHRPPGARTGNTIAPTDPSNWAFTQFQPNQNQIYVNGFWNPVEHQNTNALPHFDLQQHGVNASPQGNPMGAQTNVQTSGASQGGGGGFLPPTSIR